MSQVRNAGGKCRVLLDRHRARSDGIAGRQRYSPVVRDNWQHEQVSGSGRRYKGDQSSEGASRWAPSDFPAVVLLVGLGTVVLGLLLSRMAHGGNMKGQAMLAIAPRAVAVFVSARARRSPWSYSQRLILHVVLAVAVVLVWVSIFTQPRVEGDGTPIFDGSVQDASAS